MSLLAVLLAPAVAVQSAPADPVLESDVRCLAVMAIAASDSKKADAVGVMAAAMYFVGRIDGRRPGMDYRAALRQLLSSNESIAGLQADAVRCGAILEKRGSELQALGEQLKQDAKRK